MIRIRYQGRFRTYARDELELEIWRVVWHEAIASVLSSCHFEEWRPPSASIEAVVIHGTIRV